MVFGNVTCEYVHDMQAIHDEAHKCIIKIHAEGIKTNHCIVRFFGQIIYDICFFNFPMTRMISSKSVPCIYINRLQPLEILYIYSFENSFEIVIY